MGRVRGGVGGGAERGCTRAEWSSEVGSWLQCQSNVPTGACKMAQLVKALAAKPDGPKLEPMW